MKEQIESVLKKAGYTDITIAEKAGRFIIQAAPVQQYQSGMHKLGPTLRNSVKELVVTSHHVYDTVEIVKGVSTEQLEKEKAEAVKGDKKGKKAK